MTIAQQLTLPIGHELERAPRREARRLTVAGLFAGIGGIELGLSSAGHRAALVCENEPSAVAVLTHRFPELRHHGDVCTLRSLPRDTDLVAAGFPCQDLSQAGKTVGIEGSRSGLVGEVFRLLRHRRVPWVLLENVPFMLQLSRGRALAVIVDTLEHLGYRWAYRVVDSRAFGVPQRRERVYLVASLDEDPRHVLFADDAGEPETGPSSDDVACGFYWTEGVRGLGWAVDAVPTLKGGSTIGIPSPPAIWLPSGEIVKPEIRDAERMQGFKPGWTSAADQVSKRNPRWKLVGNAVTVPVAKWIGSRLAQPGDFEIDESRPIREGSAWPRAAWNVGHGRMTTTISAWPKRRTRTPLAEFLRYETTPLSERATEGFLKRTEQARLRFPPGFIAAVRHHLKVVSAEARR